METYNLSATKIEDSVRSMGTYMYYGDDDRFPEDLIDLYKNSSLHHTLIESISQMIAGEGLYSEDEAFDYSIFTSDLDEDLEEIFSSAAKQMKIHGYCYIEVIKKPNKVILNVIPAEYVRNGEHGMLKLPSVFYINTNPDQGKNFNVKINAFDGRRKQSLLYIKRPDTTTRSYSSPDYLGAINDILTDYKAKRHKLNSIENGFMPMQVMTLEAGNKTKEQKKLMENKLTSKFTGSESENRVMVVWKSGENNPVQVDAVESVNMVDFFKDLGPEVNEAILIGHRATSPALFGLFLEVKSGLGNNAEELKVAYSIFLETVIKPFQSTLLKGFTKILAFSGQNVDLSVAQLNPGVFDVTEEAEDVTETQDEGTKMKKEQGFFKKLLKK